MLGIVTIGDIVAGQRVRKGFGRSVNAGQGQKLAEIYLERSVG